MNDDDNHLLTRKRIYLTDELVGVITKQSVKNNTSFSLEVERLLIIALSLNKDNSN